MALDPGVRREDGDGVSPAQAGVWLSRLKTADPSPGFKHAGAGSREDGDSVSEAASRC